MSRTTALSWQGIVIGLAVCGLLVAISVWAVAFVMQAPEQPSQQTNADPPEPAAEESIHPVRRGWQPNVLLVRDYTVELDTQLLSDLGLSFQEVETVLKREYDPERKKLNKGALVLRGPTQDPRLLPQQIIRLQAGRPLYLEDIAIIRDPQGKALD